MAEPNGTGTPPGADHSGTDTIGTFLVRTAVAAGVTWTAVAEYSLARMIGSHWIVALSLPVALDVYVVAAIRRGRDLFGALATMGIAQIAAHLLEAHQIRVSVPLVAAVAMLVPLSIWRVHALAKAPKRIKRAKRFRKDKAAAPAKPVPALPRTALVPVPVVPPVPKRAVPSPAATSRPKRVTATVTEETRFDAHVRAAREWLAAEPDLTGTAVGQRLGTGDSYGRRVLRAAKAPVEVEGPRDGQEGRAS